MLRGVRPFSSTGSVLSRVGKMPVGVPEGVTITVKRLNPPIVKRKAREVLVLDRKVIVSGPKGTNTDNIPDFVQLDLADGVLKVSVQDESVKQQKTFWGTFRGHLNNYVTGVSEGFITVLKFVGTGYRAAVEEKDGLPYLAVKVGASHPQGKLIPPGITATAPNPARVILEGINLQQLNLFAAQIRAFRPPEPYKGKGIFVNQETIKLKAKKVK